MGHARFRQDQVEEQPPAGRVVGDPDGVASSSRRFAIGSAAASAPGLTWTPCFESPSLMRDQLGKTRTPPASRKTVLSTLSLFVLGSFFGSWFFVSRGCSILAQVSLSVTVRLKTGRPAACVGVDAEVAEALELVAACRRGAARRVGSSLRAVSDLERVGIQDRPGSLRPRSGILAREQPVVEPHLGVDARARPTPSASSPSPCGRPARRRRASPGS